MEVLIFDDEEIGISAYDQCWKKEDFISLRDDYDIIYNGGIVGLWIEKRKNHSPLVHIMTEDDGYLSWRKETDKSFDAGWLDDWKSVISKTQVMIKNHPKKYK